MDFAHFGLARPPFRPAPVPDAYYPAAAHDAALAALTAAFRAAEGVALIDGGSGVGKTLTALRLVEELAPSATPVVLPSARFARPAELHQAILFDLGKPHVGLTDNELRLAVTDHLLGLLASKARGVLVLDESQHLGPDLLEEVRLLDNLGAGGEKALFTVLVGPADVRDRVSASPLGQRVGCRVRVEPLSPIESAAYLRHHVERCGGDPEELLSDEAVELLVAHAGGVPRVLNQLAAAAFAVAREADAAGVDAEAALEALTRAGIEVREAEAEPAAEDRGSGEGREAGRAGTPKLKGKTRRSA